jgi:galactonate dehydratase
MLRLAETMRAAGVAFSPHNPTGPVSHAVSAHVSAAVPALDMLEMQFDETPNFDRLQTTPIAGPSGGTVVRPRGAGLGVTLNQATLDGLRTMRWTAP